MTFDFQTFDTPEYERWLIIEIGLILAEFALDRPRRRASRLGQFHVVELGEEAEFPSEVAADQQTEPDTRAAP